MGIFSRYTRAMLICLPFMVGSVLSGCGGGGGGSTLPPPTASTLIIGTAAAGAPVVGYVSVRDSSSNSQPVKTNIPIQANGNYSVDVTGLIAPFAFLASGTVGGKTVSLYSAATAADVGGTINITPFTDLIIRNIAATAVDTFLATPTGMASLTAAQLDAKRVALTTQLTPALTAMGLSASTDLLRATFNADSTGLDRFMDVVQVSTTATTATITNILDAANALVITTTTGSVTGTLGVANLAPSATPLDGILATGKAFSALFANGLPSPTDPNLIALFATDFMDGGVGRSAFLTNITSQANNTGIRFTNPVLDSVNVTTGIAIIHFGLVNAAGQSLGSVNNWQMKLNTTTNVWQEYGNQRIADVKVATTAGKQTCNPFNTGCNMTTTYSTGLNLSINNKGLQPIGMAVVTGPGLPSAGVTEVAQLNQTQFQITTSNPNSLCAGCTGSSWYMADTDIAAMPAVGPYTYMVQLYDTSSTPVLLATYTEVAPVKPVLNTALAGLTFPSISSGMINLAGTGANTLTLHWTIPAGMTGDWLSVNVAQGTGGSANLNQNVGASLTGLTGSGTSTLVITAPSTGSWGGGNFYINARDQYGGGVSTNYQ